MADNIYNIRIQRASQITSSFSTARNSTLNPNSLLHMEWPTNVENPVLHVVVVGFHHKKGCQVEYSYPPLIDGKTVDSNECPDEWKHLPSLALPDGAHNFTEDTVYFHLPSRSIPKSTVFGVSCYRQIDSTELLNRGTDVTRNTVQKSVCVLSRLPVFGLIQAKLELITHAYFKGRDFSQVALLEETYKTLNMSLTDSLLRDSQVFLGLSCRDLLHQFQHKILVLFKLMLLEKRVLFYSSPVKPICTSLLTIVSLFPGMIERGLGEAANYSVRHKTSSVLQVVECDDYLNIGYRDDASSLTSSSSHGTDAGVLPPGDDISLSKSQSTFYVNISDASPTGDGAGKAEVKNTDSLDEAILNVQDKLGIFGNCPRASKGSVRHDKSSDFMADQGSTEEIFPAAECNLEELLDKDDDLNFETDKLLLEINEALDDDTFNPSTFPSDDVATSMVHKMAPDAPTTTNKGEPGIDASTVETSVITNSPAKVNTKLLRAELQNNNSVEQTKSQDTEIQLSTSVETLPVDEFGFPLSIFKKGVLCHPYLSLHLYDLLSDVSVRGFVIGATNALFKQKTELTDVVIELSELRIDIHDQELRRQLTLTMADMRFAENLVRSTGDEKGDIYLDDTEWEGGDDWLRGQFRLYLLSLMATVSQGDDRMIEDFNTSFATAWKTTHNYKQWRSRHHSGMAQIQAEHPFHGQLSMADVRLRINQVIQQADRNKKINAVVTQTGKVVTQTGKAVGDALNSAKSSLTTWFGSIGGSKT